MNEAGKEGNAYKCSSLHQIPVGKALERTQKAFIDKYVEKNPRGLIPKRNCMNEW